VVNLSSLYGIIAPPGQTAYSASKFAVRGFSEALRLELSLVGIGVTRVHPGGIRTRIAESARQGAGVTPEQMEQGRRSAARLLRMDPAKAAGIIVRGIERRKARVLIGSEAYLLDALARALPVSYGNLLLRAFTRQVATSGVTPSAQAPQ
jgi:short-subunit dehydrogenase